MVAMVSKMEYQLKTCWLVVEERLSSSSKLTTEQTSHRFHRSESQQHPIPASISVPGVLWCQDLFSLVSSSPYLHHRCSSCSSYISKCSSSSQNFEHQKCLDLEPLLLSDERHNDGLHE